MGQQIEACDGGNVAFDQSGGGAIDNKTSAPTRESGSPSINSVEIRCFKRIKETRIELAPITYLVGGNNSGKSSVLQAIHTAVSCAQVSVELDQKVVAESSLRYSPAADFSLLGHGTPYENRSGGQRGVVTFEGLPAGSNERATYSIKMYKARNHSNVGVERSGDVPNFGQVITDPKKLFSVYVPGLAGVPHREEMSSYAAVFRKAASGEANLVFRNIIRLLDKESLLRLETLLESVLKTPIKLHVNYDPDRDLYVDVKISMDGSTPIPVDLWGTGILQVTQIFAYVLHFKPAFLLVDEPDSHLHPSRQKALAEALERVALDFQCKVLVSTHSRHLITGASEYVKVIWMKDGKVESDNQRELATILMELGALDQLDFSTRVIICTEDQDPRALKNALDEAGYLKNEVKIVSFNGIGNRQVADAIHEVSRLMPKCPRVILHRDRDFLTAGEIKKWSEEFESRGVEVFCPPLCDTEAYHCTVQHISEATGLTAKEATDLRSEVIDSIRPRLEEKFRSKRRSINRDNILYPESAGTPDTDAVMSELGEDGIIYGKDLLDNIEKKLKRMNLGLSERPLRKKTSSELSDLLKKLLGPKENLR